MTTYHKRHKQETPAEKWYIELPEEAKFPQVTQIFNLSGSPVSWQHTEALVDGKLVIDFGLDELSGIAEYSYETDGDLPVDTIIGANGGVINIHIHQYNV